MSLLPYRAGGRPQPLLQAAKHQFASQTAKQHRHKRPPTYGDQADQQSAENPEAVVSCTIQDRLPFRFIRTPSSLPAHQGDMAECCRHASSEPFCRSAHFDKHSGPSGSHGWHCCYRTIPARSIVATLDDDAAPERLYVRWHFRDDRRHIAADTGRPTSAPIAWLVNAARSGNRRK